MNNIVVWSHVRFQDPDWGWSRTEKKYRHVFAPDEGNPTCEFGDLDLFPESMKHDRDVRRVWLIHPVRSYDGSSRGVRGDRFFACEPCRITLASCIDIDSEDEDEDDE